MGITSSCSTIITNKRCLRSSNRLTRRTLKLEGLLGVHAEAEEEIFYPELLKLGNGAGGKDSAEDETENAIHDCNEVRDAVAVVPGHKVGRNGGTSRWRGPERPTAITSPRKSATAYGAMSGSAMTRTSPSRRSWLRTSPASILDKDPQDDITRHE